jgi:hypothetical protein
LTSTTNCLLYSKMLEIKKDDDLLDGKCVVWMIFT